MTLTLYPVAIVLVLTAACGPTITNPSGTCGTRSNGGRIGYHAPDGDDIWVPDCQNPLRREYWRAFTKDGQTAYLIPRPDGAPELQPVCTDPQHQLRGLVDRYLLCAAAMTTDQVTVVNSIDLADALRITRFLHTQLKFVMIPGDRGIQPYAIPADILDACTLGGHVNSAELEAICESERVAVRNGIEPRVPRTGPGGAELVSRLNELYGIR